MITLAESGLGSTAYAALRDARTPSAWRVIAHRYNLRFSTLDPAAVTATGRDFGSAVFLSLLYRLSGIVLERYSAASGWTTVTGYGVASSPKADKPKALVTDGTTLAIFTLTSSGISRNTSTNGTTWAGQTTVVSDATIAWMAATSPTRVHYVAYDSTTKLYRFKVADYSGSWTVMSSNIYYPYPLNGLTAAAVNGADILVAATQVPGAWQTTVINAKVVSSLLESGGLIGFSYKNGTWGDHFEIDVLDELHDWRYRAWPRLTLIDDTLYLTAYSSDGSEHNPYEAYRLYRSKDGRRWTRAEVLPVPLGTDLNGFDLQRLGNTVYAVEHGAMHSSPSTPLTGLSTLQLDITTRVEQASLIKADQLALTMTVNNEQNWTADTLLDGTNQVLLEVQTGYWVDGATSLTVFGTVEIDALTPSKELPNRVLQITARDRLAWMMDRTQSEQFHNWESQLVAGDNFTDITDTNYGGLAHTAAEEGTFQTPESLDKLVLMSNNAEGLAFSTWKDDLWNGQTSIGFALATTNNSEFAGVLFRSHDKDNLYGVRYRQAVDKIELFQRVGGVESTLYASSTLSWSATPLTVRYLLVRFRYAEVTIFTSTDNITWTLLTTQYIAGQSTSTPVMQAGYVGVLGRGYSPSDVWPIAPTYPLPAFPDYWPFDGSDIPGDGPIPAGDAGPTTLVAITTPYLVKFASSGEAQWTDDYNAISGPHWHFNTAPFVGSIRRIMKDPANDFAVIVFTASKIYRLSNIYSNAPTLTLLWQITPTIADNISLITNGSVSNSGSVIAVYGPSEVEGGSAVMVSTDGGASFSYGAPQINIAGTDYWMSINSLAITASGVVVVSGAQNENLGLDHHFGYWTISGVLTVATDVTPTGVLFNALVSKTPIPGSDSDFLVGATSKWAGSISSISPAVGVDTSMSDATVWWSVYQSPAGTYHFILSIDGGGSWSAVPLVDVYASGYKHVFAADLDGDTAVFVAGNTINFWDGATMIPRLGNLSYVPSPDSCIALVMEG